MNCSAMVVASLTKEGYDGLTSPEHDCACLLDDLMPCGGEGAMECIAGHKVAGCSAECGEGCDFHVFEGKKKTTTGR